MLIFKDGKGRIREGGNQEAKPGAYAYLITDYGIKGAEEEVTDAEYHKWMAEQNAADLAATAMTKAQALLDMSTAAGEARSRHITILPGQESTYRLKAEQAQGYTDAGYPADATPWQMINAEAAATGMEPAALADVILLKRDALIGLAAQVEALRLGGKQAVEAAADDASARVVADDYIARLSAI